MPPTSILRPPSPPSASAKATPTSTATKHVTFADLLAANPSRRPAAPNAPIFDHPVWRPLHAQRPVVYDVCPELSRQRVPSTQALRFPRDAHTYVRAGAHVVCDTCGERLSSSATERLVRSKSSPRLSSTVTDEGEHEGTGGGKSSSRRRSGRSVLTELPADEADARAVRRSERRAARLHARRDGRIAHIERHGALATMKRFVMASLAFEKREGTRRSMLDVLEERVVYKMYVACWEARAAAEGGSGVGLADGVGVSLRRMEVKRLVADEGAELAGLLKDREGRMDRIEAARHAADRRRMVKSGNYYLKKFVAKELDTDIDEVEQLKRKDLEAVALALVEERVRRVQERVAESAVRQGHGFAAGYGTVYGVPPQPQSQLAQPQSHAHPPPPPSMSVQSVPSVPSVTSVPTVQMVTGASVPQQRYSNPFAAATPTAFAGHMAYSTGLPLGVPPSAHAHTHAQGHSHAHLQAQPYGHVHVGGAYVLPV